MIVQCADCKTSFRLRAELVPPREIQVRCAQCGSVFAIDGRNASAPPAAAPARSAPDPSRFNDITLDAPPRPSAKVRPAAAPAPAAPSPPSGPARPAPGMEFEIERSNAPVHAQGQAASATALETPPEAGNATFRELDLDAGAKPAAPEPTVDPELQKQQNKARRLARALVSDILVYNREKRDSSLKSGNLVQALGPEIKKSWEVYKERVTPELANSTDHFREALNEILAEGQPIF